MAISLLTTAPEVTDEDGILDDIGPHHLKNMRTKGEEYELLPHSHRKKRQAKNEGFFWPLLLLSRFRAGAHIGKKEGEKGKTEKTFFTATAGPARSATAATAATAARAATVTRMTLQNFYYIITVNKRYLRNRLEQFKRSQAFLIIGRAP